MEFLSELSDAIGCDPTTIVEPVLLSSAVVMDQNVDLAVTLLQKAGMISSSAQANTHEF
jgi:hypothetical protein